MSEVVVSVGAFRRMALALPEATEAFHMDHPDFRAAEKLPPCVIPRSEAMRNLLFPRHCAQSRSLTSFGMTAFRVFQQAAKGAWGLRGATSIQLRSASKTMVREALASAWRNVAPRSLARQSDLEAAIRANRIKLNYQS